MCNIGTYDSNSQCVSEETKIYLKKVKMQLYSSSILEPESDKEFSKDSLLQASPKYVLPSLITCYDIFNFEL